MVTFQFTIEGKDWTNAVIHFQLLEMHHTYTVAEFSILLKLYDRDFTERDEFRVMELNMGVDTTIGYEFWQRISTYTQLYDAGCSKASTLHTTALRYIHAVLSHSITGRDSSTGAINKGDLTYLWSMVQKIPIHLGYWLAQTIHHQCTDTRVGNIDIGPYVTGLTKWIGIFDLLDEVVYREMKPVGFDMLMAVNRLQYSLVNAASVEEKVVPDQQPSTVTEQACVDFPPSIKDELSQIRRDMGWIKQVMRLLCANVGIEVPDEPSNTVTEVPSETSNSAPGLSTEVDDTAANAEGARDPYT